MKISNNILKTTLLCFKVVKIGLNSKRKTKILYFL